MPIPILSYTSQVKIKSSVDEPIFVFYYFKLFKRQLDKAYIKNISEKANTCIYKGTPFRFSWNGWNKFNGVTSGKVTLKKQGNEILLNYQLNFYEVFVLCLIFMIIPTFGIFDSWLLRIGMVLLIGIVYLGNFALAVSRLNSFFEESMEQINSEQQVK